jgi:hypothetical protein
VLKFSRVSWTEANPAFSGMSLKLLLKLLGGLYKGEMLDFYSI